MNSLQYYEVYTGLAGKILPNTVLTHKVLFYDLQATELNFLSLFVYSKTLKFKPRLGLRPIPL